MSNIVYYIHIKVKESARISWLLSQKLFTFLQSLTEF